MSELVMMQKGNVPGGTPRVACGLARIFHEARGARREKWSEKSHPWPASSSPTVCVGPIVPTQTVGSNFRCFTSEFASAFMHVLARTLHVCAIFGLVRLLTGLVVSAALVACGGGGGGSESSPGAGDNDAATGIRVLHAVIDGAPVDLFSSARSEALTSNTFFADNKGYRGVPSGEQTIRLSRALDPSNVVASLALTSNGDDSFSVLYFGSVSGAGVRAKVLEDVVPTDISGAAIRFVNGVGGVSMLVVNASGSAGAQRVPIGEASNYMMVAAGDVTLTASTAVDRGPALSMVRALEQGAAYTVLVAGEAGYYTKGVLFRDR